MTNWIIALGLALDIVGAFLIALPDLPHLKTRFRFGRLRKAQRKMELGGVTEDEIGFEELVELVDERQNNIGIEPGDVDKIEFGPTENINFDSSDGVTTEVAASLTVEYAEDAETPEIPISSHKMNPNSLYSILFRDIESDERKFRAGGFIILSTGFALQLIGTLS